jgi:uncharacterized protein
MSDSPVEVVGHWLQNLLDPDVINSVVAPDAISGEDVAVFGDFRYKSNSLGKVVSSPFAILSKVIDGKVTYLQYLEDSYATAASFRKDGSWTIQTEVGTEPFRV